MKVAIASGKGGTGKTFVATSLALCAENRVQFIDCDVEEPNGHIFLNPDIIESKRCVVSVPKIIKDRCTLCGKCSDICQFNAIIQFGKSIMVFPE